MMRFTSRSRPKGAWFSPRASTTPSVTATSRSPGPIEKVSERQVGWAAVSRAVRLPSQAEKDITLRLQPIAPNVPVFPTLVGNHALQSQQLLAYEIGWREQPTDAFSWDIAAFYNRYDDLDATQTQPLVVLPPGAIIPLVFFNGLRGETYGFEISSNYRCSDRWRVTGNYSFLKMFLHSTAGDPSAETAEGDSPINQVYAQSSWDLAEHVEFDLMLRYVDRLPAQQVRQYITMDARLGWTPRPNLELALVGQNLLDAHLLQFNPAVNPLGDVPTEVPRGIYGMATWRF